MAKATINTGVSAQPVHTRTTADSAESQVVVLGTDGSDAVVDPASLATAAKQDTIIGHLDGVEGLLTTIDADTGSILTAVQLIDDAIAGTEMQVDVVAALPAGTNNIGDVDVLTLPALPAGTNAIGKLAANSGVDIGDVDVTSVTPGTAAASLGKAEDAVHASGDTGIMALAVRKDTASALAGTDGDYIPLVVDASGRLHVAVGSIPAAALTTDSIGAAHMTNAIMSGTTQLTPKFFSETVTAADTDEELVALVSAKKIRVLSLAVHCGGTATDITFESSTTTRIHKVPAGANGGQILPFNPVGWFETAAGASLTVTTGAGSSVEISGCYVEV